MSYDWLKEEKSPRILVQAVKLIGTKEIVGKEHNPDILFWAKELKAKEPMLGDVLTFKRDGGGHVGIYVGEDKTHYHVLGGNQSNMVNVVRIAKTRLFKARRTLWKIAQPANVRKVYLEPKGIITTNEA